MSYQRFQLETCQSYLKNVTCFPKDMNLIDFLRYSILALRMLYKSRCAQYSGKWTAIRDILDHQVQSLFIGITHYLLNICILKSWGFFGCFIDFWWGFFVCLIWFWFVFLLCKFSH